MVIADTWKFTPSVRADTLKAIGLKKLFPSLRGADGKKRRSRWFISHRYADSQGRDALLAALPKHVAPVLFPPIETDPDQFVSDALIAAIRACDGLAYVGGFSSEDWQWVEFERRFALRTGMRVAAFQETDRKFKHDIEQPNNLIIPIWNTEREPDHTLASHALGWLQSQRAVHAQYDTREALKRGAAPVVFLTNASCMEDWPTGRRSEIALINDDITMAARKCLFAWLEPPDRAAIHAFLSQLRGVDSNSSFQRFVLHASERSSVQIADGGALLSSRLDDLLVRIEYHSSRNKAARPDATVLTLAEEYEIQKRAALAQGVPAWQIEPLY